MILDRIGVLNERFSVEWVSAAEGIRFVQVITGFSERIRELGPFGDREQPDTTVLGHKLNAALMAVEGRTLRMAFAKQSKLVKESGEYGRFPGRDKLLETLTRETTMYEALIYLGEKERSAPELAGLLGVPEDQAVSLAEKLKKKNMWDGELSKT
jgi:hypothetical protein